MLDHLKLKTLGDLKKNNYVTKSIKDEIRNNLILKIKTGENPFPGIHGYDDSVIPELERAILSKHNIILLGLRGQGKTKIARLIVNLLDDYIPIVEGSELNDDPYNPISKYACDLLKKYGDDTPIQWMHKQERYSEKLATPDVTVADLIGDIDPIKAATLQISYSDERVIHYGIIPRSNRCIFVINELPDLQARIQVALFNILQEGDIQIRGFKIRLPLDIQFVFTANPEDYTNRGTIVTPLKDRIDCQIITHYPKNRTISKMISEQEMNKINVHEAIYTHPLINDLCEQIGIESRKSEYVDQKSGVSARMTISIRETIMASAELRLLKNNEQATSVRISDVWNVIPAITGKIELVYEGEQEGSAIVAQHLIGKAIRVIFSEYFNDPETEKKSKKKSSYQTTIDWFREGNKIEISSQETEKDYRMKLYQIPGLYEVVNEKYPDVPQKEQVLLMELVLFGLAEYSLIARHFDDGRVIFKDFMESIFKGFAPNDMENEDEV